MARGLFPKLLDKALNAMIIFFQMDENLRKFEEMTKNVTVANIFTRKDMTAAIAEESGQKRMASIFDNQDYVPLPSSRRYSE